MVNCHPIRRQYKRRMITLISILKNTTYMNKRILSFWYAVNGIHRFFRCEYNGQIQLAAACTAIIAGFLLHIERLEWIVILLCCALVLALEMVNTAVEKVCDLVSTDYHPLIKIAKDVSAGAVLLSAFTSAVIGALIFIPKLFSLLNLYI